MARDQAKIRETFCRYEYADPTDKRFNYRLAVPKWCRPAPRLSWGEARPGPFLPVAYFEGIEPHRLEITVYAAQLPCEIGAGDCAEIDAEFSGAKVLQRRDWQEADGRQAEIMAEYQRNGESWIRRTRLAKDGNRAFRIDAAAPKTTFTSVAEEAAVAVMSFQFASPENAGCAESLQAVESEFPVRFSFRYPASWTAERRVDGNSTYIEMRKRHEHVLVGTLRVEIHRMQPEMSASRYVRRYAEQLKAEGIFLNGAPIVPAKSPRGFLATHVFAPEARRDGAAMSVPLVGLEQAEAIALLGLVGPGRDVVPLWWAVNKRAFEIVRDSLALGEPVRPLDTSLTRVPPSTRSSAATKPSPPRAAPPARKEFLDAGSY
jgi:hypothetical protein